MILNKIEIPPKMAPLTIWEVTCLSMCLFFRKNFLLSPWPKFSPHSCICVRREYLAKIFKIISIKKFPEVWMDFRVLIYAYLEFGVNNILEKHLTFYRQYEFQSTSSYKLLSKKWLKRRLQSHKFYNYVCKKLDKNKSHNHDFFVTSLLYKVFKTIWVKIKKYYLVVKNFYQIYLFFLLLFFEFYVKFFKKENNIQCYKKIILIIFFKNIVNELLMKIEGDAKVLTVIYKTNFNVIIKIYNL